MRKLIILNLLLILTGCDELARVVDTASSNAPPTKSEIAAGLREALEVGAQNSVAQLSRNNGFLNNPAVRIPFPPEAEKVAKTARDLGLDQQVDQFVETMNHGAEKAAARAKPIFIEAIRQMTITDVYDIYRGENDAATQYLKRTTMGKLKSEFRPEIKRALEQVEITRYWNPVINAYNQLPLTQKLNPDLEEYVLEETLNGLFHVIAKEEAMIRENPQARVTDLLRKVFGQKY